MCVWGWQVGYRALSGALALIQTGGRSKEDPRRSHRRCMDMYVYVWIQYMDMDMYMYMDTVYGYGYGCRYRTLYL